MTISTPGRRPPQRAALLVSCLAMTLAQAQAQPSLPFKLTGGFYQLGSAGLDAPAARGLDVNLRHTDAWGDVWLGFFRSPGQSLSQTRAGWDNSFTLGPVRLQPSLQAASGGFWGGSFGVETGDNWFVGAGLGRTNLRNYVNLNFDPNDAWMLSGGYRWQDARALSLQVVHDNRQHPDQQHVHLIYRTPLPEGQRLTLDLLHKRGTVDGEYLQRIGLSATYDWPRYFVKVAYDPKVNFTAQDMWRLQLGTRF